MEIFILVLAVLVCVLLSLIILVQNPKGGGLATGFTGGSQVGGVQKTTDFLEKSTWYLVVALFVLCLASARFSSTARISGTDPQDPDTEETTTGEDNELDNQGGDIDFDDAAGEGEE
ncbi:MAG: preprotein translocase subunit SecG [Pyrinomonadaceae bacterium]|nr:preprotein translocase subunit SecG [Flavobacteriales bacterium]NNE66457.1 preprotein translocase subunit SecG [Pyrinomonadaceae bacterium]